MIIKKKNNNNNSLLLLKIVLNIVRLRLLMFFGESVSFLSCRMFNVDWLNADFALDNRFFCCLWGSLPWDSHLEFICPSSCLGNTDCLVRFSELQCAVQMVCYMIKKMRMEKLQLVQTLVTNLHVPLRLWNVCLWIECAFNPSTFVYRTGRYRISLIATNGIGGDEEDSITVHITNVPRCYPPEINILGVYSSQVSLKSHADHSTHRYNTLTSLTTPFKYM